MTRALARVAFGAVAGAVAGAVCVALAFARDPALVFEMDGALPGVVSGVHGTERHLTDTFAWTSPRATLTLPGLDRRVAWTCVARLRGARPPGVEQPVVDLAVDGARVAGLRATNEYRDVAVAIPPRPGSPGLTLTIQSTPAFVPGPSDRRQLGAQVDRLACAPAEGALALPPRGTLSTAALTGAVFGGAFGALALTTGAAVAGTLGIAAVQAVPMAAGAAPYTAYASRMWSLAAWIALAMIASVAILQRLGGVRLHAAARFVVAFAGAALFLELAALLHPSKAIVDALFHAHRFEWVMDGRYFFTQPMPSGVRFPYAIGLYVFAGPWSVFTSDHVLLLRVVVCAVRALASALLYWLVVRSWGDRLAGAFAVVLCQAAPLPFIVIGNANLTFAFAQSAAQVTIVAAAGWRLHTGDRLAAGGLGLLAAIAFLSHVGIFPVLLVTLLAMAACYAAMGGAALRAPALRIGAAALLAAIVSVASYYGHFSEAYGSLDRVRARAVTAIIPATPTTAAVPNPGRTAAADPGRAAAPPARPLHMRTVDALALSAGDIGWPTLLLAGAGLWRCRTSGARDRLGLALAGMGVTYAAFLAFSVLSPVEPRFQRYTHEFISRLTCATIPALVVLAARGASWGWRAGPVARPAVVAAVAAAVFLGARRWLGWF